MEGRNVTPEWNPDIEAPLTDEEIEVYEPMLRESGAAGNAMAILTLRLLARFKPMRARNTTLEYRVEHRDEQVPHLIARAEAAETELRKWEGHIYPHTYAEAIKRVKELEEKLAKCEDFIKVEIIGPGAV